MRGFGSFDNQHLPQSLVFHGGALKVNNPTFDPGFFPSIRRVITLSAGSPPETLMEVGFLDF